MFSIRQRIAAIAVSLLAGTLSVAAPASADPIVGSEDGMVTLSGSLTGAPDAYAGSWVTVLQRAQWCSDVEDCWDVNWVNDTAPDPSTGAFSVSVPAGATYLLFARGDGFVANAYGLTPTDADADITAGSPIVVGDEDIAGLDIAVTAKPAIRGTITLPAAALADVGLDDYGDFLAPTQVTLYAYQPADEEMDTEGGWQSVNSRAFKPEELSEHLSFAFPVSPGTYRVSFRNYWTGEVFFGGTSLETATDITVTNADVSGIDFAPETLPVLSGTVTAPAGEKLDPRLFVMAIPFTAGDDGTPLDNFSNLAYARAAADGSYKLPAPAGDYAIIALGDAMFGFYGPEPDCFSAQGFDKGCYPSRLTVDGSGAAGVDIQLRLFPRFAGKVTLPEGVLASGVAVSAEKWIEPDPACDPEWDDCGGSWSAVTASTLLDNGDGTANYRVSAREPGTYRLVFSGDGVEQLVIGGDSAPDGDAVTFDSIAFTEVTRDAALVRQPWLEGSVNPYVLDGDAFNVNVTIYASRGDGEFVDTTSVPVDMDTLTFSVPLAAGDYSAVLTWSTFDEFGNEQMHKAFLSGSRMFKVLSGSNAAISFDATAPSAPTDPQVVGVGDGSATIGWSAPEFDGGAEVTGYTVTAVDAASGEPTDAFCTAAGDEGSCTVEGLENLREYTFSVTATNDAGDSDAAATGMAVPHEDGFSVWVNRQTSTADGDVRVWVLGANPTDTVTLKVGADTFEVSPEASGDAMVAYTLDSGSTAVRSGKVKVYATAVRTTDSGRTKRLKARTTIYVPKTKVRAIAREGATITARITSAAPDSEVSISIDGEELCAGSADRSGRLACTFDSPSAGDYTLTTTVNGVETAANAITVRPIRRL